ncbi:MAG: IPT/TIG domain-containing protein [Acidobacteriota bacterium]
MNAVAGVRRTIAVLGAAFALCAASRAQVPGEAWERIAVLGHDVKCLAFSPDYANDRTIFAGTGGMGVWRSQDGGDTWVRNGTVYLATSIVTDLAISPNYPNDPTLYAITESGNVFVSTNADLSTWSFTISLPAPGLDARGTSLGISPDYASDGTVFAGYDGDGLYITRNRGSSWTQDTGSLSRLIRLLDIAVDPNFATTDEVILGGVSQDGCLYRWASGVWTKINGSLGDGDGDTITTVRYEGNGRIWVGTKNNGAWHRLGWSSGWAACWDGVNTNDKPAVLSLDRVGGSAPKFMEGRGDSLFQSSDASGYGTSCSLYDSAHPVQVCRFEPGWNGTTSCTVFIGTPHGLLRKSCASSPVKTTTDRIDGWAVARAPGGTAHFMGSKGQGLFKHVAGTNMVRYNNFPNKQIPEITAICLDPLYDEVEGYSDGDCVQDRSVLFVAANFTRAPWDNGVYKSSDFGNTWTKLATGWPTSAITLYDLAISPNYREGGPDTTLYAATSIGVYRWNGPSTGWSYQWRPLTVTPVYRVAVPPLYNRYGASGYAYHGVFASTDNGAGDNEIWFSDDDGVTWEQVGYPGTTRGRVTGFAFDGNFGGSGSPSTLVVSAVPTDPVHMGGVFTSNRSGGGWGVWSSITPGSGSSSVVWDVSTEPTYLPTDLSRRHLGCATNGGVYFSDDAGASWSRRISSGGFSVQYDRSDSAGQNVVVGLQTLGARLTDDGASSFTAFTGYHYLPDDVWATVAHDRDPNVLFSSSPSMGVFVSEDKGISYRPWNRRPPGTTAGPCVLRSGLGLAMLTDRRNGTGLDIVWAGTVSEGIKARYIYYDSTTGKIDLETENGTAPNGWRHNTWYSDSSQITGRWERIEVVPGTADEYPVWASSQTGASAAQGMAALPAGPWWSQWRAQNTGLPSLETRGMRQGYGEPDPIPLLDGQTVGGEVAYTRWDYYSINVPSGADDLGIFLNDLDDGGPQDPDLYVRFGGLPTTNTWDFRPYVNGDESVCVTDFTLVDEDFNGAWGTYGSNPPPGWTILDGGDEATPTWNANDWHKYYRADGYGYAARVYWSPLEHQDEELITPPFDIPSTAGAVNLEFDHFFNHWDTASYETCTVRYRSDQHPSWITLATYTNDTPDMDHVTLSLLAYKGDTSAQIGFRYYAYDGYFWQVDNVRVSGTHLKTGTWYLGVRGYSSGTSPYELTATLNAGCTAAPEGAAPQGVGKAPSQAVSPEGGVDPKAPTGRVIWGTVNGPSGGVYVGTGDPSGTVTWEARNGVPPNNLTNLSAQTVYQLTDLTLIAGCAGDVFYSPSPDEGLTTWVNATSQMASPGSNDFRDLLEASNGDALVAAHGVGTGTSAGGVWLSGDKGAHWMRLSQGFDADKQLLTDLMADSGTPPQYYSSTDGTGVYSRTITAQPYPTLTDVTPASGSPDGGTEVTITGTGFSTECPTGTASDCPDSTPVVLFGDTEVSATYVSATELRAVAPAHAAGAVTVRVRNPDTRRSVSGRAFTYACEAPSGMANNTAVDVNAYADTGVRVSWTDPAAWNDGGSGTRSFAVYRNGALLQGGLSSGTHECTDLTGMNGVSYSYTVRASNGCGLSIATAGAAAADQFLVPEEVPDTSFLWAAGTSDTLTWSAATGATSYRVYRGDGADVGDLPTGASACLAYEGTETTTGALILAEPPAGQFYWYLVVGVNGAGEGSAGMSRTIVSSGACASP